jgi:cytochrome c oxidase assembly factor CtaG/putative copper export protein
VNAPAAGVRTRRPRRPWSVLVAAAGVAAVAGVALLELGGGAPEPSPVGIPDPGPLTGWGLLAVGIVGDLLAVAVVGALVAPLLTMSRVIDELGPAGLRAVVAVRRLAPAWLALCLVEAVLVVSDQLAVPAPRVEPGMLADFLTDVDQGRMLALQSVLVAMLAVGSRWVLTVRESAYLLGIALLTLVPPILTGHAASSGGHDLAVVGLLLHVGAATLWMGGVVALWWHLASATRLRARAARRFSSLAAWCFAVTAASGVAGALVRLDGPAGFLTTTYGRGALAKVLALVVVGLVAARARRWVLETRGGPDGAGSRELGILTGLEVVVLSAAVGLGVALSRTPPPVGEIYPTLAESLAGGPVPPVPTATRLLLGWNPSGVGLAVVLLGAALYVAGLIALRRRGERWPVGRTVSWSLGLVVVAMATLGGLGTYSHVLFSAHMVTHMALSMVAPILLVLGAPVNLALRALPGADVPGGTGPRQLLAGALASRPARVLTHPVVAAAIFVGSLYAVYLTPVFDWLMLNHLGHAFMELHFLLAGCLFYEVLIGKAPMPSRLPYLGRVALLLLVMPLHAFFAVTVMGQATVIGGTYYDLLDRPWSTDLLADQHLAGSLTWAFSEVPMVILVVVILAQWYRDDTREAGRLDRQAARDGDAALAEYNARLAALAQRDGDAGRVTGLPPTGAGTGRPGGGEDGGR